MADARCPNARFDDKFRQKCGGLPYICEAKPVPQAGNICARGCDSNNAHNCVLSPLYRVEKRN